MNRLLLLHWFSLLLFSTLQLAAGMQPQRFCYKIPAFGCFTVRFIH